MGRVMGSVMRRAESRHDGVADIFVDRATMGEDLARHAAVKFAQQSDYLLRPRLLRQRGKTDDVGKQDRDILLAHHAEWLVALGQLVDQARREIACEVGPCPLGPRLPTDQAFGPPHRSRENSDKDQHQEGLLDPSTEIDEVRIAVDFQQLRQGQVGINRQAGLRKTVRQGQDP